MDQYSEDDLTETVIAEQECEDLLSTRLPHNDSDMRYGWYLGFKPGLLLGIMTCKSIVDKDLGDCGSGEYRYW